MDRGDPVVFTGLVELLGRVRGLRPGGRGLWTLSLQTPGGFSEELRLGDSVCVSGACLTVTARDGGGFDVQMMEETHRRTTLGALRPGDEVNLERALPLGGRLDGHLVQGHVDGVGVLVRAEEGESTRTLRFSLPPDLAPFLVPKGSVAVDGVSLTVIEATRDAFSVGLIPTTLGHTTLQSLHPGDRVNLETDLVGRYLHRFWEMRDLPVGPSAGGVPSGLDWDKLREYGWDRGGFGS